MIREFSGDSAVARPGPKRRLPTCPDGSAKVNDSLLPPPLVSVLVAAWNEVPFIDVHIASFRNLSYPKKELVICAGGEDETFDLASRHAGPDVVVLHQSPGVGKQRSLQQCLERARGSIIYLTDADCVFTDEAFDSLIRPILDGTARIVSGVSEPLLTQRSNTLVQYQWYRDRCCAELLSETMQGVLGRNCAMARSVLDSVGGFTSPASTGTDYVLGIMLQRHGHVIHAARDSRMRSDFPETPGSYLRMWRRWNKNLLVQGLRYGSWRDALSILYAASLYAVMLLLPLFRSRLGPLSVIFSVLLAIMAVYKRFTRVRVGAALEQQRLTPRNVVTVPYYTALDIVAVFLAIFDAAMPSRRSKW